MLSHDHREELCRDITSVMRILILTHLLIPFALYVEKFPSSINENDMQNSRYFSSKYRVFIQIVSFSAFHFIISHSIVSLLEKLSWLKNLFLFSLFALFYFVVCSRIRIGENPREERNDTRSMRNGKEKFEVFLGFSFSLFLIENE